MTAEYKVNFFYGATAPSGPESPHYRASTSHPDTPQTVELLRPSQRPVPNNT
jgi:hypothetical protein